MSKSDTISEIYTVLHTALMDHHKAAGPGAAADYVAALLTLASGIMVIQGMTSPAVFSSCAVEIFKSYLAAAREVSEERQLALFRGSVTDAEEAFLDFDPAEAPPKDQLN